VPYRSSRLYRGDQQALYFTGLTYSPGWRTLYARATYTTRRRALGALGVVWQYGADITLAAGAVRTLIAKPADPFQAAVAPVAGTDYVVLAGAVTVTLSASSGLVAFITLTAGGAGCTLTGPPASPTGGLQLRAQSLTVVSETTAVSSVSPAASAIAYGAVQTLAIDGWPEIDPAEAEGVCNAWVQRYNVQRPQLTITLAAADSDHLRQILSRSVSDRITLRSTSTGVDGDAWIEARELSVSGAGGRHVVAVWRCEMVDAISGSAWDAATTKWDNTTPPATLWGF
jgi:hypothetical protein